MELQDQRQTDEQSLSHIPAPAPAPVPPRRLTPVHLVAVFVAGVVLGGLLGYFGGGLLASRSETQAAAQPAAAPGGGAGLMASVVEQTRHFKGDPDAPVTMIEFSDFRCPYCSRHAADAGRRIHEEYVETGVVRVGYYNLAFLSPESQFAAEASECAADQEAFWEYHDLLFERLPGGVSFSKDNLKQFAAELGLDTAAFNDCLDSGKYEATVRNQTAAAGSIGVQSTPTFLINGQPVVGAQPFEVFQQVIEAQR